MMIKAQNGLVVNMADRKAMIASVPLNFYSKDAGSGPYAVMLYFDEKHDNGDDVEPVILGVYCFDWIADSAIDMIPDDIGDKYDFKSFHMPSSVEAINHANENKTG